MSPASRWVKFINTQKQTVKVRQQVDRTSLFFFSRARLASTPLVCACRRTTAALLRFHSLLARNPLAWACSTTAASRCFLYWQCSWRERTCACSLAKPSWTWCAVTP